jgi:hypothetical protein
LQDEPKTIQNQIVLALISAHIAVAPKVRKIQNVTKNASGVGR